MVRILGIDPGSRVTGFGIIDCPEPHRLSYVASGVIRTQQREFSLRLRVIFQELSQIIGECAPDEMAVEDVFVQRNPSTALKLGQARGAAICAGVVSDLPVAEYTPRSVKQALTGAGGAGKDQVQYMVRHILGLTGTLQEDAGDALAVAVCHSHQRRLAGQLAASGRGKT